MPVVHAKLRVSLDSTSITMNPQDDEHLKMYFYENRLKTFEGWPFEEDCLCTPENVRTINFSTVGTFQNENLLLL